MTSEEFDRTRAAAKFYGTIVLASLAWSVLAVTLAELSGLPVTFGVTVTFGGLLLILAQAMKSPVYLRLRNR